MFDTLPRDFWPFMRSINPKWVPDETVRVVVDWLCRWPKTDVPDDCKEAVKVILSRYDSLLESKKKDVIIDGIEVMQEMLG